MCVRSLVFCDVVQAVTVCLSEGRSRERHLTLQVAGREVEMLNVFTAVPPTLTDCDTDKNVVMEGIVLGVKIE